MNGTERGAGREGSISEEARQPETAPARWFPFLVSWPPEEIFSLLLLFTYSL
jgi:hypothetical protein